MTVNECYTQLRGNYGEAVQRLRSDALISRFILKFPNDPSFSELEAAIQAEDVETAFRAAHTLKGVCANLSFTALSEHAHNMTELLRAGNLAAAADSLPTLKAAYDTVIDAIRAFEQSNK